MIVSTAIEQEIMAMIEKPLDCMGYGLVRIRLSGKENNRVLQIMIECLDGSLVEIEDCEAVSNYVSALLDVEDPIRETYNLEVSSPGIDRPLTRLKDFQEYVGLEVKLEVKEKIDGQGKFRGRVLECVDKKIIFQLNLIDIKNSSEAKSVEIEFDNIKDAKLVFTDELMALQES